MTGDAPAEGDDAGTWATPRTGRLPGDIAARVRAAREAGVEERHIRLILAEAFAVPGAAATGPDQGRVRDRR
ncbi:hypothetical protein [Streptomyces sp. NRRL B-24484]|uniref:hypothetical protein n=1 Tax=Streptomyces sp. NRRL B-24484 TaxID=1463833 RepID=UPI000A5A8766|nr:hypothetical protein [Streptomyces sp. NRRL B-24484]